MPNENENTVVTPSSDPATSVVDTTTPVAKDDKGGTTTLSTPSVKEMMTVAKEEWEKKDTEIQRMRSGQSTMQKRLDRLMRQRGTEGPVAPQYGEEDISQWASHPMSQEMLIRAAEVELKDGVQELLKDYPSIPDQLKKALQANPRGWVKPGTVYVEDAVNDIEDFLLSISQEEQPAGTPNGVPTTVQPKQFPVAGNNAGGSTSSLQTGDPQQDALLELFQKGKAGINEAFRRLTDREVNQATFDKAVENAEKMGISFN